MFPRNKAEELGCDIGYQTWLTMVSPCVPPWPVTSPSVLPVLLWATPLSFQALLAASLLTSMHGTAIYKGVRQQAQPAWDTWGSHSAGWNLCQSLCLQPAKPLQPGAHKQPQSCSGLRGLQGLSRVLTLGPSTLPLSCFPALFHFLPGRSAFDGVSSDTAGVCGELRPPLPLSSVPCLEGTLTIWPGSILSSKGLPGIPGPFLLQSGALHVVSATVKAQAAAGY